MKKRFRIITCFVFSVIVLLGSFLIILMFLNFDKEPSVNYKISHIKKKYACKKDYLSYSFEGKLVKITRESKIDWMYINVKSKIINDNKCDYYIKQVYDSIIKITFAGMLTYPHYHFPLKTGGYVYKRKGSSAIFYKWKGKTFLISDVYCSDFSIDDFYLEENYPYFCDTTLNKVTTGWYWYLVGDMLSN